MFAEFITISLTKLIIYVLAGVIVGYIFGSFLNKRDIVTNWEWTEDDYRALAEIILESDEKENKPKKKRKPKYEIHQKNNKEETKS